MTRHTRTALCAATIAACLSAAAPAGAQDTIHYRIGLDVAGTWSETVRADLAEGDTDQDGTEELAARDTSLRWALTATMPDVPLRGGRVVKPVYDVADATLTQEVLSSSTTDWDGAAGTCVPQSSGATGGGTVATVGAGIVFRPSSDAFLNLVCEQPFSKWSWTVDLLRIAAAKEGPPAVGESPIDATFAFPTGRFGGWRVALPVAASAQQRAFERCPREDPGHTIACPFDWKGTVTLERLTPEVTQARLSADRRSASVLVRCATACAPVVRAGGARRTFSAQPGAARRLTLRLPSKTRRALRRTGRLRLAIAIGDHRSAYTLRASR